MIPAGTFPAINTWRNIICIVKYFEKVCCLNYGLGVPWTFCSSLTLRYAILHRTCWRHVVHWRHCLRRIMLYVWLHGTAPRSLLPITFIIASRRYAFIVHNVSASIARFVIVSDTTRNGSSYCEWTFMHNTWPAINQFSHWPLSDHWPLWLDGGDIKAR